MRKMDNILRDINRRNSKREAHYEMRRQLRWQSAKQFALMAAIGVIITATIYIAYN
mgnify:CR=1 FL=1|jgi:hypothetical protein